MALCSQRRNYPIYNVENQWSMAQSQKAHKDGAEEKQELKIPKNDFSQIKTKMPTERYFKIKISTDQNRIRK